jgi:hypothetical protein
MPSLRRTLRGVGFAIGFIPVVAAAEILSTGEDTDKVPDPIVVQSVTTSCSILWFHRAGSEAELDRLRALGYDITVVDGAPFLALSNLLNYGTVVIAYTGPELIADRQADLEAYVDQGGGLLVHQPNHVGAMDYMPHGFDLHINSSVWCAPGAYVAEIADATHPVTAGCTDADLSGAFDTVGAIGPSWRVLARNTTCGDPALAVGVTGLGRVAFDTGNGNTECVIPGTELYWDHLFSWLCTPGPVAVEATSWGSVKASYR